MVYMSKKSLVFIFLITILGCFLVDHGYQKLKTQQWQIICKTFPIQKIKIIEGHLFDIRLSNNQKFLCRLSIKSTSDAKSKVVDLFGHSSQPKVTLLSKKSNGQWLVKITLMHEKKTINLEHWLIQNGLVYE